MNDVSRPHDPRATGRFASLPVSAGLLLLPFAIFAWMTPFVSGKGIGKDYPVVAIHQQLEFQLALTLDELLGSRQQGDRGLPTRAKPDSEASRPRKSNKPRPEAAAGDTVATVGNSVTLWSEKRLRSHIKGMDVSRPAIAMALTVLEAVLRDAHRRCAEANVALSVLLIPSKQWVFDGLQWAEGSGRAPLFREAVERETDVTAAVSAILGEIGLPHANALAELRAEIARGDAIYKPSNNGHPVAGGHRAYARAALSLIDAGG